MDIVVPAGLVTVATVVLAFVINQALKWAKVELSETVKKGIVFAVATGLTGYFGYQAGFPLGDPAADPMGFALALLAAATAVFKVAQPIYDRVWQGLLAA